MPRLPNIRHIFGLDMRGGNHTGRLRHPASSDFCDRLVTRWAAWAFEPGLGRSVVDGLMGRRE